MGISANAFAAIYAPTLEVQEPSGENENPASEAVVTFYGEVYFKDSTSYTKPAVGAQVKIVGTDTPGGIVYTQEDGSFELVLPIVPHKSDDYLLFAIEIQQVGAVQYPIAVICNNAEAWALLGIKETNAKDYLVANAIAQSYTWDIVGKRIKCTIPLLKEK